MQQFFDTSYPLKNPHIICTIGTIADPIQMGSKQHFRKIELNYNLYIYIIQVCEEPEMFLEQLTDDVQIDRTRSFQAVKKLIKLRYFDLTSDMTNQKIKRVFPTQKSSRCLSTTTFLWGLPITRFIHGRKTIGSTILSPKILIFIECHIQE